MDNISILLQEAAPLYHRRRRTKRLLQYNCLGLMTVLVLACPVIVSHRINQIDIDGLYADLYYTDIGSTEYYIDEFDAIGII